MPSGTKKRKAAKRRKEKKQWQQPGPPHSPPGDGEREEEDDLTSREGKGSESSSGLPSPNARDENQHRLEVEADEEPAESGVDSESEEKSKKEREISVMVDAVDVMESTENGGSEQPSEPLAQKTEGEVKSEAEVPVVVVVVEKDDMSLPPPLDPIPPTSTEVPMLEEVSVEHLQSEKGKEVVVSEDSPPSIEHKQSDTVDTASPVELSVPISEEVVQAGEVPVESLKVVESVAESLSNKNEEKVVSVTDTATEQPDAGADRGPHTETREIAGTIEVARSTQLQQRSFWMSCCGLFDVITGANR